MRKATPPNKPASPKRRRFLKMAAAGAALGITTPVYAHEWEPEHLDVVHTEIKIAGWPASAAGMRIGQLSDLHCQDGRAVARTARAALLLAEQKPDVVLLTGDYISGMPAGPWIGPCARALAPLQATPGGVFAILGNHDWWSRRPQQVAEGLRGAGFHVLRNESAPLPGAPNVWLVGLDDRWMNAHDPVKALLGVPKDAVKILLVHEPDYADEAPAGFALQLSGHSHGGQVRVPGLGPIHCPKYGQRYPEGLQQTTQHPVYTTRGVGMIGPQFRFCCPPEVTVLTIRPA